MVTMMVGSVHTAFRLVYIYMGERRAFRRSGLGPHSAPHGYVVDSDFSGPHEPDVDGNVQVYVGYLEVEHGYGYVCRHSCWFEGCGGVCLLRVWVVSLALQSGSVLPTAAILPSCVAFLKMIFSN